MPRLRASSATAKYSSATVGSKTQFSQMTDFLHPEHGCCQMQARRPRPAAEQTGNADPEESDEYLTAQRLGLEPRASSQRDN